MRMSLRKLCSVTTQKAEHLKNYLQRAKNFEQALSNLKIISLENGKCIAEIDIEERHTNSVGTLHGGFTATLVDVLTAHGLNSLEKGLVAHMYMKGAVMGKTIIIESETIKRGKSLSFLEAVVKDKDSGSILAKGEHTTYALEHKEQIK